jgi:hypothetical protein
MKLTAKSRSLELGSRCSKEWQKAVTCAPNQCCVAEIVTYSAPAILFGHKTKLLVKVALWCGVHTTLYSKAGLV